MIILGRKNTRTDVLWFFKIILINNMYIFLKLIMRIMKFAILLN